MERNRSPQVDLSISELEHSERLRRRLNKVHSVCFFLASIFPFRVCLYALKNIAGLFLPPLSGRLVCPTVYGFDLCVSPRAGKNYYLLGFYEIGTLQMMKEIISEGDVFVDAGSSEGQMSAMAATLVGPDGKVIAVEPQKQRYEDLVKTIHINGLENVIALNVGLGREKGQARLYTDGVSPTVLPQDGMSQHETINIVPLDDILGDCGCKKVRMLKIDVEGFELEVLKGAISLLSSDDAPAICVEIGVYGSGYTEFFDFLSAVNRYQLFRLTGTKSFRSKLKRIDRAAVFEAHDNVMCLLPEHLQQLPSELLTR